MPTGQKVWVATAEEGVAEHSFLTFIPSNQGCTEAARVGLAYASLTQ